MALRQRVGATIALVIAPITAGACAHYAADQTAEASAPAVVAASDIVDTAVAAGDFTTLVAALQAADLVDTLRGPGPFTVFAPTDEAFAALPDGTVETLLQPENIGDLQAILTYHVIAGEYASSDLAGQTLDVATVNGASVAIDATNGVRVGDATVIAADVDATNGVVHVIDTVLLPPES